MAKMSITKIPGWRDIELTAFYESFEWYYPNCELQTKDWFVKNAQEDWVYIDCGANIGYYSILFSQLSPAGFVHAVEPTTTADLLDRNLRHNHAKNVKIHRIALAESGGVRSDRVYRIWGEAPEERQYEFTTVDQLVFANHLERLDCIKIDVDSFDFEVLKGAEKSLLKYDPWIVIELSNSLALRNTSIADVLLWLQSRGYETAIILDKENFIFKRVRTVNDPNEIPVKSICWLLERDLLYDLVTKLHGVSSGVVWANNTFAADSVIGSARNAKFVKAFKMLNFPASECPGWQCFQYAAFARTFEPDCILQFGRWGGEFTVSLMLGQSYATNSNTSRLWSFCESTLWKSGPVYDRVVDSFGSSWLDRAECFTRLPVNSELNEILDSAKRVLVFWNETGIESATIILGSVMPLIRNKAHVVILHGISDGRFGTMPTYEGDGANMLALGDAWSWRPDLPRILDFTTRNKLELLSPERALKKKIAARLDLLNELERLLGTLFSTSAGWHWFTLNQHEAPAFFCDKKIPRV